MLYALLRWCWFNKHDYRQADTAKGKKVDFFMFTCKKCGKVLAGAYPKNYKPCLTP